MKKKTLIKKLSLNKETIAGINPDEMSKIKGGSILAPCSESCSILAPCCNPISKGCPPAEKLVKG